MNVESGTLTDLFCYREALAAAGESGLWCSPLHQNRYAIRGCQGNGLGRIFLLAAPVVV